jgi:hypothetical protein
MLPRVDVSLSGFVAAVSGLAMLAFNYFAGLPVAVAAIGPFAVVIVVFLASYFVRGVKEVAGTIAGALVVLVQAYFSVRRGEPVDTALVLTAITALVNIALLWALPRIQP